jgi:phosphatidate cytidylyltransferase
LICVSTDIGGYFFGKILKGPKLTKISPNKTISGTYGSFILPLITGLIYNYYSELNLNTIFAISAYDLYINFKIELILVVFVVSLTSQIGDLVISYFKRLVSIKDTGTLLPGHGGLLDRIDGLIFVLPIFLIFILK